MLKSVKHIVITILMVISLCSIFATAIAVGDSVATDKSGNNIYQIEVNEIKIGYKLIGEGEPLVLINGLGWSMERWPEEVIRLLSTDRQLILVDNRGIGFTTSNDVDFSFDLFAKDVVSLLDHLNIDKADFLGFSMGSAIVQELLVEYPDRVNSAILYATSTNGTDVNRALKGKIPKNPIVKRQVAATIKQNTPLAKMAEVNKPVLLIVGTKDDIVGTESSKTLANTIPAAWLIQFPEATHMLMFEHPVDFSETVLHFLNFFE